ncbi:hypothetical protein Q6A75_00410 [Aliarcobacter skirrowii]|uniref:hypothetical protein n=1 Tax=Aliarcobacter skirrowii TaxID=28200 RepID=UPI0029AC60A8|nr:hypothetical protein [Aliarcobacter skirrowii]MDX4047383.1 hypothetical protein [Aliarcobacter skirrowii]
MVTYMQIQNFVVSQMLGDSKILNVIKDSFEKYCKSAQSEQALLVRKNLKVLNIFSEKFHNGRFSKKKADSIRVFNEYVKTDDRLGNLFSGYYGCTKLFYDFATKKREFYIDFILDFDDIVNYIERISPKIANNISKLNIEASFNKKFNPYLSLIEEYYILNLETNNPIIFNNLKRK